MASAATALLIEFLRHVFKIDIEEVELEYKTTAASARGFYRLTDGLRCEVYDYDPVQQIPTGIRQFEITHDHPAEVYW